MNKLIIALIVCLGCIGGLNAQDYSALERATVSVAETIGKSVVSISSAVKQKIEGKFYFGAPLGDLRDDPFRGFFQEFFGESLEREYKRMGLGSGVIVDKDGYILTNEHVIKEASEIKVKLSDGREFDAVVRGTDPISDLAVIKINASNLHAANLGDSDNLRIGQWVMAVGNPFGFAIDNPEPTVTIGLVSALHRYLPGLGMREKGYSDLIQTDAAINPGNSGGPLVNLKGEVVGVNTAIINTTGGYQGLGFAVPVNKAKRVVNKLIKGEKVLYGWMGVNIQDLNDDLRSYFAIKESQGVIVLKVYENSPAQQSGLKEGDLILSFNNRPVRATRDLINMVSNTEVGERVPMDIVRANKKTTLSVIIAAGPSSSISAPAAATSFRPSDFRGMKVDDLTQTNKDTFNIDANEGVVIVEIDPGSIAAASGLVVGDVISKIENTPVNSKEDFIAATATMEEACLVKTGRGYFVVKGSE